MRTTLSYKLSRATPTSDWSRLAIRPLVMVKNANKTRGGAARPPLPTSSPPKGLGLVVRLGLGLGPVGSGPMCKIKTDLKVLHE